MARLVDGKAYKYNTGYRAKVKARAIDNKRGKFSKAATTARIEAKRRLKQKGGKVTSAKRAGASKSGRSDG